MIKIQIINRKNVCAALLCFIFIVQAVQFSMAADSEVIAEDIEKTDMREIKNDWMEDELEDEVDEWSDLDKVYDVLAKNWNDVKEDDNDEDYEMKTLSDDEYKDNDYCDILEVGIKDLDEDNATLYIEVAGDAEDAERPWYLFIWSNCSDSDNDELILIAFYIPSGIGGDNYYQYAWETEELNGTGEIDFGDSGKSIEMMIPSDVWKESDKCMTKVIMLTPDSEDASEIDKWYIDISPDVTEAGLLDDAWLWLWLLLLFLILIAIAALIYYMLKRKQKKQNIPKMKQ